MLQERNISLKPAITAAEREALLQLLIEHRLPVEDLDDSKRLFCLYDEEGILVGGGGLEIFSENALLRSVVVRKEHQGSGWGRRISNSLEHKARELGIQTLYLLTTSARGFFEKEGYAVIERDQTPASIAESAEFKSLCPASAVLMKKRLL